MPRALAASLDLPHVLDARPRPLRPPVDRGRSELAQRKAALGRFIDQVHALGGITVLNHPFYGNKNAGEAIAWGYTPDASQALDAVEVWNISWAARHDTNPVADSDNYLSLPWWEREIVSRRHIPAVPLKLKNTPARLRPPCSSTKCPSSRIASTCVRKL